MVVLAGGGGAGGCELNSSDRKKCVVFRGRGGCYDCVS
jgi:hypothetical protein